MSRNLYFIYVFMLFTTIVVTAQPYRSFPTSKATWDVARCWSFYPGGWHDEYAFDQPGTDTLINGNLYRNVYMTIHHAPGTAFDTIYTLYMGGVREANKKIFIVSDFICLDTLERVVYDFNPSSVGDTVFSHMFSNGPPMLYPKIITQQDSMLVGTNYHRRIYLADTSGWGGDVWIEGVGSMSGLIYADYYMITDNSYDLTCFYVKNQLVYGNPSPTYGFCMSPLPTIICDSVLTGMPHTQRHDGIDAYPNPFSGNFMTLTLPSDAHPLHCVIMDIGGRIVSEQDLASDGSSCVIRFTGCEAGVYLLTFPGTLFTPLRVYKLN